MHKQQFLKKKLIFLQLVLLGIIASGFFFIKGWTGFNSFLLGNSTWFIPTLYFLWKMRYIQTTFDNQKMLKNFFFSTAIRLAFSFGMITLILLTCNIDRKSFLSGYILMVLISFIAPLKYRIKNV